MRYFVIQVSNSVQWIDLDCINGAECEVIRRESC